VEGLSRSASCIDPARSRTRLLSLLPVSRRLFPPLFVHFPVCVLFLPLSLSSPLSFSCLFAHSFSPLLSFSLYLSHSLFSFLPCTRSSPNPFEENTACLPTGGLRFRARRSLFSALVSELSTIRIKFSGFNKMSTELCLINKTLLSE